MAISRGNSGFRYKQSSRSTKQVSTSGSILAGDMLLCCISLSILLLLLRSLLIRCTLLAKAVRPTRAGKWHRSPVIIHKAVVLVLVLDRK